MSTWCEVCDSFKDYFTIKQKRFNSRHSTMVNIPKFKLESARASFYVQGVVLFNDLPKEMPMVNDCKEFKGLLKEILSYVPVCNTYCGSAK